MSSSSWLKLPLISVTSVGSDSAVRTFSASFQPLAGFSTCARMRRSSWSVTGGSACDGLPGSGQSQVPVPLAPGSS